MKVCVNNERVFVISYWITYSVMIAIGIALCVCGHHIIGAGWLSAYIGGWFINGRKRYAERITYMRMRDTIARAYVGTFTREV